MNGPHAPSWTAALQKELASLSSHGVFSCVELPPGKTAIDGKYVFKVKDSSDPQKPTFKVRFVGKGFQQKPGVDFSEFFSPTLRMTALRMFLSISAAKQHSIRHYDVDAAFLNAELKEEMYINIPPGAQKPTPTSVWKLHKVLYGLKQANKAWKDDLTNTLISAGYRPTTAEPCLYIPYTPQDSPWPATMLMTYCPQHPAQPHMIFSCRPCPFSIPLRILAQSTNLLGFR